MDRAALTGASPRPVEPREGSEQVTPDMEQVLLNRLTEVAQQLSVTSQQQAVNGERIAGLLDRMDGNLERAEVERVAQHAETRAHMDSAAGKVTTAVNLEAAKRDEWWRKFAIIVPLLQISNMVMNFFHK